MARLLQPLIRYRGTQHIRVGCKEKRQRSAVFVKAKVQPKRLLCKDTKHRNKQLRNGELRLLTYSMRLDGYDYREDDGYESVRPLAQLQLSWVNHSTKLPLNVLPAPECCAATKQPMLPVPQNLGCTLFL